jgi:hypothetical protein
MTNDDLFAALEAVPKVQKVEGVPVPLFVRMLDIAEADAMEVALFGPKGDKPDLDNWRAKHLFFMLADENGTRRFTDAGDLKRISKMPAPVLLAAYKQGRLLNGYDRSDEKKSDSGEGAVSGSDSPSA